MTHYESTLVLLFLTLLVATADSPAEGVTFGTGGNAFSMEFVAIGSPFHMGSYEVSRDMVTKANAEGGLGITMFDYEASGIAGGNRPDRPATEISWFEAATFVNWLNMSQGFTPAYKFDRVGGTFALWEAFEVGFDEANPYRNSLAKYFLPSLGEWYKAAYYDADLDLFRRNATDGLAPVVGGTLDGTAVYQQSLATGPADINDAGGLNTFGTMAQGGNVAEWVETASDFTNDSDSEDRSYFGGAWNSPWSVLRSSDPGTDSPPDGEYQTVGFRVAAINLVSDPSHLSIIGISFDQENHHALLEWSSQQGRVYRVEESTDLKSWSPAVTIIAGDSTSTILRDDAPSSPRGFYRVILVGKPPPTGMVLIPAGSFQMGSPSTEFGGEKPVHTVYVSAFYLDQFEVTKQLWDEVEIWGESNGYNGFGSAEGEGAFHPVINVRWHDVVKWCNARSEKEGLIPVYYSDSDRSLVFGRESLLKTPIYADWAATGYRLPTEAEWEKAARGTLLGDTFPWGDTIAGGDANYRDSGDPFDNLWPTIAETTPVGYYDGGQQPAGPDRVNAYGLYDMAGNVWEWCWDFYDDGWYRSGGGSAPDTHGPRSGFSGSGIVGDYTVGRGGGWLSSATRDLRCSTRGIFSDDLSPWLPPPRAGVIGFRCARGL